MEHADNEGIPPSISVKYPSRQRTFRNSLELFYPSFSSSPRSVYPPFFVSPATTNKGSVPSSSTTSTFSSSTSFSAKMMRTLEPSTHHLLSISPFLPSRRLHPGRPYSPPCIFLPRFLFCRCDTFPSLFYRQAYFWIIHIQLVAILANFVRFLSTAVAKLRQSYHKKLWDEAFSIQRGWNLVNEHAECHVSLSSDREGIRKYVLSCDCARSAMHDHLWRYFGET